MTANVRCIECDHLPERDRPCPKTWRPVNTPRHLRTCAAFEPRRPKAPPVRVAAPDPTPFRRPPKRPPLNVAPPAPPPVVRVRAALVASSMVGNVAYLSGVGRGKLMVRLAADLPTREASLTLSVIDKAMR